jgi:hypothetical protein
MSIPLLVFFACGVGVPPAQKFDEKGFYKGLGCVFKPFDPPQPPLKRGENSLSVSIPERDFS